MIRSVKKEILDKHSSISMRRFGEGSSDDCTLFVQGNGLGYADKRCVERMVGILPPRPYHVTWYLASQGEYKVKRFASCGGLFIKKTDKRDEKGMVVCFLPQDRKWVGKRLTRIVRTV